MCSFRLREKLETSVAGQLIFDEPLRKHTSWKVGGPAEIFFMPLSIKDLGVAVALAHEDNVPVTILGNGTNILVSDQGVPGLTVKLEKIRHLKVMEDSLSACAGMQLPEISRAAQQHDLSGLEFAIGIPASVGGAVASNAGAHGSCMGDIVDSIRAMDYEGRIRTFSGPELCFGYRTSVFKGGQFIVLETVMTLDNVPGQEIEGRMQHYLDVRRQTQPVGCATAGSVFVNPAAVPAGYLIEMAGFKGAREGGAQVSEKHANFIVNVDNASADDIMRLIRRIQERVYSMFSVRLETEISFIGGVP